jgi:hypothetical protein
MKIEDFEVLLNDLRKSNVPSGVKGAKVSPLFNKLTYRDGD